MYKFITQNNRYENYEYVETKTFKPVVIDGLNKTPLELKLFFNDTFSYNKDTNTIKLDHSNFKSNKYIPGILDLSITHGKEKNKFLYLCKPDDKRIPFFLIPYNIPYDFDKSIKKLYITFHYDNWNNKFPRGKITQNLGNANILHNYYEYALYCKSLHHSIQAFSKDAKKKLLNKKNDDIINDITQTHNLKKIKKGEEYIFSIDSSKSIDYDDAISYSKSEHKIGIYVTNVAFIMDYLDLWNSFTNRICSIYLPDKRRTMLPNIITENLCSLKEKTNKICYVLNIYYDENDNVKEQKLEICNAYISKNYCYEEYEKYSNREDFKKIQHLLGAKKYIEVVTKAMLYFNHEVAKILSKTNTGVYRCINQSINQDLPDNLPDEIHNHISIIRGQASSYSLFDKQIYKSAIHQDINIYLQATSPIRRLVDVLNNIQICNIINKDFMIGNANNFYNLWTTGEKLDYINTASRAIRKIQSKCKIYEQHERNISEGIEPIYRGYLFDKILKEGDGKFQYMVYLPDINVTTYITLLDEFQNYSIHKFKLYVFINEENDKKKIKLQICYNK